MWHLVTTILPNQYRKKQLKQNTNTDKSVSFLRIESHKTNGSNFSRVICHIHSGAILFLEIRVLRWDQHDNRTFVVSSVWLGVSHTCECTTTLSDLNGSPEVEMVKWLNQPESSFLWMTHFFFFFILTEEEEDLFCQAFLSTLSQDSSETGFKLFYSTMSAQLCYGWVKGKKFMTQSLHNLHSTLILIKQWCLGTVQIASCHVASTLDKGLIGYWGRCRGKKLIVRSPYSPGESANERK